MFSIVIEISKRDIMRQSNIHKALSSEVRKEIIRFLGPEKRYLSEIAVHVNKTPQTVDFHLNILENSGLIGTVDSKGKKFYELKSKEVLKFVSHGKHHFGHHPKPPHEIVLDIKTELNERMDRIEKKLDKLIDKQS